MNTEHISKDEPNSSGEAAPVSREDFGSSSICGGLRSLLAVGRERVVVQFQWNEMLTTPSRLVRLIALVCNKSTVTPFFLKLLVLVV